MAIFFGPSDLAYMMSAELANDFAQGSKAFERELIDWAAQFLVPGKLFVDVGAHVGTWSFPYAKKVPRVVAIEAQRQNYYRLCAGVAWNELWNIDCHHAVATNHDGEAVLNVGVHDWSGFGGSVEGFPINGDTRPEVVAAIKLDSLNLSNVGLVKIDVEGHEAAVLIGMAGTLQRSAFPTLIVEIWSANIFPWYAEQRAETLHILATLGYDVTPIAGWPHMVLAAHR